ncbi:MAG: AMP-binding protein [Candidatus Melainabacteria bacterium]|nr:AMP-binding protein [Candidatus Melainabacteria bacterium]
MTIKLPQHQLPSRPQLPYQWRSLPHAFLHQARMQPHALAVCDSLGARLTYEQLLIKSLALANLLATSLNSSPCVGILLPPSAGAVIANLATAFLGRVSVNLNCANGQKSLDAYVSKCGLKHIITAKAFLKRVNLEPKCDLIFIESAQEDADLLTKIKSWAEAEFIPESLLGPLMPGLSSRHRISLSDFGLTAGKGSNPPSSKIDEPATIIFTAGSTSDPKGVVLSHGNILSNINAIRAQGQIKPGEIVLGVIPFFHSFGLTMTLWAPLCLGETVVFHYDPFDARRIGELAELFKATCLICTPTMIGNYIRRCGPEPFGTIRNCILGGEKLKRQQMLSLKEHLSITPVEGYGLAETAPVVACNVPNHVTLPDGRIIEGTKVGTVGLPVPGTQVRIVDQDGKGLVPAGSRGLIQVKGPQVMLGYLNQPAETARAVKDGWFNTGDIGFLDEEGFLTITGRMSQFSKIAGEMVSHMAVEEEILRIAGLCAGDIFVTAIPDDGRGERLAVIYCNVDRTPEEIVGELKKSDMPKLWIPNAHDFIKVPALPVMPNGKLNLCKLKEIARDRPNSESQLN